MIPWNIDDQRNYFQFTIFPPHVLELIGTAANEDSNDDPPTISAA